MPVDGKDTEPKSKTRVGGEVPQKRDVFWGEAV